MRVHYGVDRPACGVGYTNPPPLTEDEKAVTCRRCVVAQKCAQCKKTLPLSAFPVLTRNGRSVRRSRCATCRAASSYTQSDRHGDNSFTGSGRLCCTLCGRPYRDHRLGPRCPAWEAA